EHAARGPRLPERSAKRQRCPLTFLARATSTRLIPRLQPRSRAVPRNATSLARMRMWRIVVRGELLATQGPCPAVRSRISATQLRWCWWPFPLLVSSTVSEPSGFLIRAGGSLRCSGVPCARVMYVYPPADAVSLYSPSNDPFLEKASYHAFEGFTSTFNGALKVFPPLRDSWSYVSIVGEKSGELRDSLRCR